MWNDFKLHAREQGAAAVHLKRRPSTATTRPDFMCSCPPGTKAGSHAKFDDDAANGLGVHRADLPGVAMLGKFQSICSVCLQIYRIWLIVEIPRCLWTGVLLLPCCIQVSLPNMTLYPKTVSLLSCLLLLWCLFLT